MNKKLSILIPVYNEEKTILNILERINECKIDNFDFETIIINDGSDDNTFNIIKDNGDLSATVISNGAFFSRETRKVITPPEEIFKKIFINE